MLETLVICVTLGVLALVLMAHMAQMAYMKGILAHFDVKFNAVCKEIEMKRIEAKEFMLKK